MTNVLTSTCSRLGMGGGQRIRSGVKLQQDGAEVWRSRSRVFRCMVAPSLMEAGGSGPAEKSQGRVGEGMGQ